MKEMLKLRMLLRRSRQNTAKLNNLPHRNQSWCTHIRTHEKRVTYVRPCI